MTYTPSGSGPVGSTSGGTSVPPGNGSTATAPPSTGGATTSPAATARPDYAAAAEARGARRVTPPTAALPGMNLTKKQKIWLTIGIIAAVVLITLSIYFLFTHPVFTATLVDIMIIVLTFEVLVIGCLLALLVYQIYVLSYYLYTEVGPVLSATQETVGTVKGTATFVSGQVVNPAIKASATVTRWRRTIEVLLGR